MWRLSFQLRWRLGCWLVGLVMLAMALLGGGGWRGEVFTRPGFKYRIVQWRVAWENASTGVKAFGGLGLIAAAITGAPTPLMLLVALALLGPWWGVAATLAAESLAVITVRRFCHRMAADHGIPRLTPFLAAVGMSGLDRAFWPRAFLMVPRRTLDVLAFQGQTAEALAGGDPRTLPWVLAASTARVTLEAVLLGSLLAVAEDYLPFAEHLLPWLLGSAGLVVLGIALPWIPELTPGGWGMAELAGVLTTEPNPAAAGPEAARRPAVAGDAATLIGT